MSGSPTLFDEPVEAPKPDTVGDALIQNGFVPNSFLLEINRALTTPSDMEMPYPWNLPSRLFTFPIEITRQLDDGSRKMSLRHPLLAEHPFVKRIEETIAVQIASDDEPHGYGEWWHAVDLISRRMSRELLDTARFTTPEHIACAVSYGLDYSPHEGKKRMGYISAKDAREVMDAIDAPEPQDMDGLIKQHFLPPAETDPSRWPINQAVRDQPYANAWGHILGIEAGYFAHDRAGFLGWTALGRERFPPQERKALAKIEQPVKPAPTLPGKPAAVLADEIAPRPSHKAEDQIDLF